MASNPEEPKAASNPEQPKAPPFPVQMLPSSRPISSNPLENLPVYILPGSADAAAFVTPEIAQKFKAFIDAFDKANNKWYQAYKGLKCIDRPAFSTAGKEAVVAVNSHKVLKLPSAPVYQYDVSHDLYFWPLAVFLTRSSFLGHHRKWSGEAGRY